MSIMTGMTVITRVAGMTVIARVTRMTEMTWMTRVTGMSGMARSLERQLTGITNTAVKRTAHEHKI